MEQCSGACRAFLDGPSLGVFPLPCLELASADVDLAHARLPGVRSLARRASSHECRAACRVGLPASAGPAAIDGANLAECLRGRRLRIPSAAGRVGGLGGRAQRPPERAVVLPDSGRLYRLCAKAVSLAVPGRDGVICLGIAGQADAGYGSAGVAAAGLLAATTKIDAGSGLHRMRAGAAGTTGIADKIACGETALGRDRSCLGKCHDSRSTEGPSVPAESALDGSSRQRLRVLRDLPCPAGFSGRPGGVLPLYAAIAARVVGDRFAAAAFDGVGLRLGFATASSELAGRLAVVSVDAAAGDWLNSGRRPGAGRSLYVPAADWALSGCLRFADWGCKAIPTAGAGGRGNLHFSRPDGLRLAANDFLARQPHALDPRSELHDRQLAGTHKPWRRAVSRERTGRSRRGVPGGDPPLSAFLRGDQQPGCGVRIS